MNPDAVVEPVADQRADRQTQTAYEAAQAVHVGLWVSATRCVLTYLVAPAVGALGVVLGPAGLVLQVLGAVTATAGARRLWRMRHRLRVPYALVALTVDSLVVIGFSELAAQVMP